MKLTYSKEHRAQAKRENKSLVCVHFTDKGGKGGATISGAMNDAMALKVRTLLVDLIKMAQADEPEAQTPTATHGGVIVPAGTYWLGDPCYACPKALWSDLLDRSNCFAEPMGTVAGHNVYAFGTAHGDGTYLDREGNEYPVDAGLIGLTPVSLSIPEPSGCHKITFNKDVECYSLDGVLYFGHVQIDTDPDDEEDEY